MTFVKFIARMIGLYFTTLYNGLRYDPLYPRRRKTAPDLEPDPRFPPLSYLKQCEEDAATKRRRWRKTLDLLDIAFD